MPLFWGRSRSIDERQSVSVEELQSAISHAVRKYDSACDAFVGVIVQPETPKSRFDANWTIKGVKFGKSDRNKSTQAVATILPRMQQEFILTAKSSRER
jgi:hypothetical protein